MSLANSTPPICVEDEGHKAQGPSNEGGAADKEACILVEMACPAAGAYPGLARAFQASLERLLRTPYLLDQVAEHEAAHQGNGAGATRPAMMADEDGEQDLGGLGHRGGGIFHPTHPALR